MRRSFLASRVRPIAVALAFCALLFSGAGSAFAHPAPSVLHDYIVALTPTELTVDSYLRVSPELVAQVYREIDTNGDGQTSQDESDAWFQNHPAKLKVALDGTPLKLSISQAPPISKEDLVESIAHPIRVSYSSKWTTPIAGKHRIQVTYGDNYIDYDEYYISVAKDTANDQSPVSVSKPKYPATYQIVYHIPPPDQSNPVPSGEMAPPPYYQGAPTPGPASPTVTPVIIGNLAPVSGQSGSTTQVGGILSAILDSIRNWNGQILSGAGLVLLALLLGALHALTPGHGKTMVAAYLVGSKGRVKDAVLLGGVVTFTHTIGVIILGLILLFISTFTVPKNYQPILELAAGIAVIVLGAYLLLKRWRDSRAALPVQAAGSSRSERSPARAQTERVSGGAKVLAASTATASTGTATQVLSTTAVAPKSASVVTEHEHAHSHGSTTYAHTHDGHTHTHTVPNERLGLGSLIGLGVSGGLVPCPDALAIMLLAAGVGQFALGIGLVVSFSIGLAAVLIGIGVALVVFKGALERSRAANFTSSDLWTRWVPLASAALVILVGVVMTITAIGGFRS